MEFCLRRFRKNQRGDAAMTEAELQANIYMWLTLDRDGLWQWYRELGENEFANDPIWLPSR